MTWTREQAIKDVIEACEGPGRVSKPRNEETSRRRRHCQRCGRLLPRVSAASQKWCTGYMRIECPRGAL